MYIYFLITILISFASITMSMSTGTADSSRLKEIKGHRFILALQYNTENNFLKTNVYKKFGLDKCYLHEDLEEKILSLVGVLEKKQLKLVFFDCFRPLEVQQDMWKIFPNPKYVANPKTGSNHNRGVAVDVGLAKEDGTLLNFPTPFDDFTKKAGYEYTCGVDNINHTG